MKNKFFNESKNFGLGCMRLPMNGEDIDYAETSKMVDKFLAEGFDYFDTAHGYHSGKSEIAIKKCLTSRHPRESYLLTDKLTGTYFDKEEDIRPLFKSQLEACGVEYFDFYLMHAQTADVFEKFKRCHAYETAFELKKEGKIRHVGLSFHDKASVLDKILTEYPQIEVVQIQLNYVDYDDINIQSRLCYEVCVKHNKPVIIMEPVKGGMLASLHPKAQRIFDEMGDSAASYAIRFAASHDNVFMVLSGMSNMDQLNENISFMKDFKPLTDKEKESVYKVSLTLKSLEVIPCTACKYCIDECPKHISIPHLFADMNAKSRYKDWSSDFYYKMHTKNGGKASECIKCGKCEQACPQHLKVRELLTKVAKEFENVDTLESIPDINEAKRLLSDEIRCAVIKGNKTFLSAKKGIAPLMELIEANEDYVGGIAADRVVGKAAALLYVKLGIKEIYAQTLSKAAVGILEKFGIKFGYDSIVEYIRNRQGDGVCPMEKAVTDVFEPNIAVETLKNTIASMRKG